MIQRVREEGRTYGPYFGSVHQPTADGARGGRGSWPRNVAGGKGRLVRAALLYRAEYALPQLGEEGRSCRDGSFPLDTDGRLPYPRKGRDIRPLLRWFALSCRDAARMGRFHQSHQRPSAGIDLRIFSGRLDLVA